MIKDIIQEVVNKYACDKQDILVGHITEHSVFLEMGKECKSCPNYFSCQTDLIDRLTQEFHWITNVRVF